MFHFQLSDKLQNVFDFGFEFENIERIILNRIINIT